MPESRDSAASTILQLAGVAVLLAAGAVLVRRWAQAAAPVSDAGDGEPTPLWQLPLVCAGLTLLFALPRGAWDAGLRVTGGCLLVGLAQAILFERVAARSERERGGTLVRLPGSRLLRGTRLGRLS